MNLVYARATVDDVVASPSIDSIEMGLLDRRWTVERVVSGADVVVAFPSDNVVFPI